MQMAVPLFLDLDGSILDPSQRYYDLHCQILASLGLDDVDFAEFWRRKRSRASLPEVVFPHTLTSGQQSSYWQQWHSRIETPELLGRDRVIAGARAALQELAARHPLVLVTLRRRKQPLLEQLADLDLAALFTEVQVGFPDDDGDTVIFKARLVRESACFDPRAWAVGDTEVDVRAGKAVGLVTVAVESGLRSAELLRRENPDFLLHDITQLRQVLPE